MIKAVPTLLSTPESHPSSADHPRSADHPSSDDDDDNGDDDDDDDDSSGDDDDSSGDDDGDDGLLSRLVGCWMLIIIGDRRHRINPIEKIQQSRVRPGSAGFFIRLRGDTFFVRSGHRKVTATEKANHAEGRLGLAPIRKINGSHPRKKHTYIIPAS